MRLRARKDYNHNEIVSAFRRMGASVAETHNLGGGFPDIVVGLCGLNVLVEIKDGSKPPSGRKLTGPEREFRAEWAGWTSIVETIDDAIELAAEMRSRALAAFKEAA